MADNFLNKIGLKHVFSKVATLFSVENEMKRAKEKVFITTGDGVNYKVSVPGVTELYAGLELTIIPHTVSTNSLCGLNVNNLGAKYMVLYSPNNTTGDTSYSANTSWITPGVPVKVLYDGEKWIATDCTDLTNYKVKQTAKTDPSASGKAISFIDGITQDEDGVITATKKSVDMTDAVNSDSSNIVASAKAVKTAYDLAKSKADPSSVPTKTSQLTNDSGFLTNHQDVSGKLDKSGGTMTGPLTLSGAPTANLHAATKKYVDDSKPTKTSQLTNDSGYLTAHQDIGGKLNKAGDTMTGPLTLHDAPTSNLHAATKKYVDDSKPTKTSQLTNDSGFITDVSGKLDKAGGTMTGALVAQNNTDYGVKQVRNVYIIADGASLPSGSNGDICLVYTP